AELDRSFISFVERGIHSPNIVVVLTWPRSFGRVERLAEEVGLCFRRVEFRRGRMLNTSCLCLLERDLVLTRSSNGSAKAAWERSTRPAILASIEPSRSRS